MQQLIQERLKALEKERNITILYACESGSRAWGFASPNSDWDVRFVYAHSMDWYLQINEQKDQIDLDIDANELDLSGWELRKLLRLFGRSNASPFEWLQSPIVYADPYNFKEKLWHLQAEYFKPKAVAYHYLGLAKNAAKKGLLDGLMDIKKYFYVLRPLLAAYWICHRKTVPPMEFAPLLEQIKEQTALYEAIQALTMKKIAALEGDKTDPVPIIQDFIEQQLITLSAQTVDLPAHSPTSDNLNNLFRKTLRNIP